MHGLCFEWVLWSSSARVCVLLSALFVQFTFNLNIACVHVVLAEKRNGEQDVKLLRNARKAVGAGGSMSDDEPLYDSVCSDEDYASIGDSQSVKEESNASKTQVSSSKETIDTMVGHLCCLSHNLY